MLTISVWLFMVVLEAKMICGLIKPGAYWPVASRRLVFKIISVRTSLCVVVCVCLYVSIPRLLITSGVMWRNMESI